MNLNVCHLARGRGGQLVSLHAQGVHGLPACKPLELCFHQVGLEAGEVQRREVVQVVPENVRQYSC